MQHSVLQGLPGEDGGHAAGPAQEAVSVTGGGQESGHAAGPPQEAGPAAGGGQEPGQAAGADWDPMQTEQEWQRVICTRCGTWQRRGQCVQQAAEGGAALDVQPPSGPIHGRMAGCTLTGIATGRVKIVHLEAGLPVLQKSCCRCCLAALQCGVVVGGPPPSQTVWLGHLRFTPADYYLSISAACRQCLRLWP